MSNVRRLISSLGELYKKLLGVNEEASKSKLPTRKTVIKKESTEDNSVDSFFEGLEQEAAENRKRIADLGFWTEEE